MAKPKKGALHQVLVPMVDSTDFASVKSAVTESDFNSGATRKFWGWNTGSSAATTSGSISKTGSLVRSGVFRLTLKTTENNYDMMMIRVNKTGCAEQIMTWSNVDNDDSDIMSALTVIQSMASDAASAAQQGSSRVLLVQSRLSDFDSRLVSDVSDIRSMLSDMMSDFQSRVPKAVATNSQLSDLASDLRSYLVGMSATESDIYSMLSDMQSDFQSRVPKRVATDSQLSDALSDLRSLIVLGVGVTVSAMSDIASQVWAHAVGARVDSRVLLAESMASDAASAAQQANSRVLVNVSALSDVYSMLSDFKSDFQSRVPKAVATNSQLSDLISDLRSYIGTGVPLDASSISDVASAVWGTARVEPTAVVSPTGTMRSGLEWLVALSRNKITQTATVQSLRNDADAADIASAAVSDDGVTFTRGEFA